MMLYSLGELDWKDTQLIYHAMAHLGKEGVVICRPRSPYYCIGFHQSAEQELDLARLRDSGEPYFRRETGGGTVRLDKGQVFYQIVVPRDSQECPPNPERFYERYLQPALDALVRLGLEGVIAEPNDIHVDGTKVSGNGGGDVGECKALVGDILVDFDPARMVHGLNCPTEEFREACLRSMRENVASISDLKPGTTVAEVERALRVEYLRVCGAGETTVLPRDILAKARELEARFLSEDWLSFPGPKRPGRRVKVREGVFIAALPVPGADGTPCGHLQFEVRNGAVDNVVPIPDRCRKDCARALADPTGPFIRDLGRLLQDMDVERRDIEKAISGISAQFTDS